MAIDTAAKRASCLGLALIIGRCGPIPDGSLANAADRAHIAYSYSGLVGESSEIGEPTCIHNLAINPVRLIDMTIAATRSITMAINPTRSVTITILECEG